MEVLNFCYQFGFLGKSQRRGQITLTFKKGDLLDLFNWRPSRLQNCLPRDRRKST